MEEIIKYLIPGLSAIGAAWVVLSLGIQKEREKAELAIKLAANEKLIPLRISAYERCVLFLERIHPASLLPRSEPAGKRAELYEAELINEIQTEYEYNVVQQIYVSPIAWNKLVAAKNDIITTIQKIASEVDKEAEALVLATAIIKHFNKNNKTIPFAIEVVKKEVAVLFFSKEL